MSLPLKIVLGDTTEWEHGPVCDEAGNDLLPSEWDLKYYFRKASGVADDVITVEGTADGDIWTFSNLFAVNIAKGTYYFAVKAINIADDEIIKTVANGSVTMIASILDAATFDGRSQARQDLEAVQAAMRAIIAGGAVQSYTIGTRQLQKMRMEDLILLESKLKSEVVREEKSETMKQGLGDPSNLYVRFKK